MTRLYVHEWDGGDRVALLVHGITADSGSWWRVGPELADRGYHVYAPHLRGHGRSRRGRSAAAAAGRVRGPRVVSADHGSRGSGPAVPRAKGLGAGGRSSVLSPLGARRVRGQAGRDGPLGPGDHGVRGRL